MKKKIKDLTRTEAQNICDNNGDDCSCCPLHIKWRSSICFYDLIADCVLEELEKEIEVEVDGE